MEYERFNISDKEVILKMLNSGDEELMVEALVGMVYGVDDWRWVQDQLLRFVSDERYWVVKNAIEGLGEVARFHRKLDLDLVTDALSNVDRLRYAESMKYLNNEIELFFGRRPVR